MASSTSVPQLRGLALPALRTAGGYFATKDRRDVAWGDLIMAVMTPTGSRPMSRGFGSALHTVLFEPAVTGAIQARLDYVIREAVSRNARHIVVEGVQAVVDANQVKVLIAFSLADDRAITVKPLLISKSDVVNLLAASRRAA